MSPAELIETIRDLVRGIVREELADADMLDVNGAAALLAKTPAAIRQAVHRGDLPCIKIGRSVRFSRAALLAMAKGSVR